MEVMSAEVYQKVWFVFPYGLFSYCIFLGLLRIVFSKKVVWLLSLLITLTVDLLIISQGATRFGVYCVTSVYLFFGLMASIGGASRNRHGRFGGRSRSFGGGSSGGGGASGSW